jgi:hypothetical protein
MNRIDVTDVMFPNTTFTRTNHEPRTTSQEASIDILTVKVIHHRFDSQHERVENGTGRVLRGQGDVVEFGECVRGNERAIHARVWTYDPIDVPSHGKHAGIVFHPTPRVRPDFFPSSFPLLVRLCPSPLSL